MSSAGTGISTSPRSRPHRRRRARRTSLRSRRSSSTGPSRLRVPPTSRWPAARATRSGTRCGRSARPRRCMHTADGSSTAPWRDLRPHAGGPVADVSRRRGSALWGCSSGWPGWGPRRRWWTPGSCAGRMGGRRRPSVTTGARRTWAIPLGCAILETPSSKVWWIWFTLHRISFQGYLF